MGSELHITVPEGFTAMDIREELMLFIEACDGIKDSDALGAEVAKATANYHAYMIADIMGLSIITEPEDRVLDVQSSPDPDPWIVVCATWSDDDPYDPETSLTTSCDDMIRLSNLEGYLRSETRAFGRAPVELAVHMSRESYAAHQWDGAQNWDRWTANTVRGSRKEVSR